MVALNLSWLPEPPALLWLLGPGICLTVAATLSLAYNRSRVFLVCCLLVFALWVREQDAWISITTFILAGAIPLNILLICLYRERGIWTAWGVGRLLLLAVQFVGAVYWIQIGKPIPAEWLDPLGGQAGLWLDTLPFPQVVLMLLLISLIGCVIRMGFDTTPISQGMTTALMGLITGISLTAAHAFEIFIMASSLYLAASIIRDSYNMAYRDELTGLPHRRALNEHFLTLGSQYTVAMLDVDHFKKFNDTHGHDIGDQVLAMVASRLRGVQGGGRAYRYGGEEFTIIFPRTHQEDACFFLDEVRKAVQAYEMVIRQSDRQQEDDKASRKQRQRGSFRTADKRVSVTISIGVADHRHGASPDEVLKAADKALYAAKKGGRNQVAATR
ncbi:MAG: GGDEF domain-containing protein [Proteobacteria bacterium]|nr:GGDEF domain-containing protein [Pseudomonadota bacterium]